MGVCMGVCKGAWVWVGVWVYVWVYVWGGCVWVNDYMYVRVYVCMYVYTPVLHIGYPQSSQRYECHTQRRQDGVGDVVAVCVRVHTWNGMYI